MKAQNTVFEPQDGEPILCRSRTEAYWLFAFDTAGIPYKYEPQYFIKPEHPTRKTSFRYLPDIYLPNEDVYVEVKGRVHWQKYEGDYRFSFVDPFCLWQQLNEKRFEKLREHLKKPYSESQRLFDDMRVDADESLPYTDVWVVGGQTLPSSSVTSYSRYPAGGPSCESCHTLEAIQQTAFHVQSLGICPECQKLSFFWENIRNFRQESKFLANVGCYRCGWQEQYRQPLALWSNIFERWSTSLAHAYNGSRLYDASPIDQRWFYRKDGKNTEIKAPPSFYTERRQ